MGVAKKMLSVFMAALLSIAAFEAPALTPSEAYAAEAPTYGFSDVVGNEWFAIDEVLGYATDHGIISGYDDGRLGAYDNVTRGQVAVVLHRLAGEPEAQAEPFADVDYGVYYGPAINWARSVGVINGYWDEAAQAYRSFGPDDPVTREQLATMLANYAAQVANIVTETDESLLDAMPDAGEVDNWARESVGWALDAGLMSGVVEANGSYVRPLATAQRCAMAKMASVLHRDILPPEIDPNAEQILEYKDGVIEVTNYEVQQNGAVLVSESDAQRIAPGDIVAFAPSEKCLDGLTQCVASAEMVGDKVLLSGDQADLKDVYKTIHVQGISSSTASEINLADGVTMIESEDGSNLSGSENEIDIGEQTFTVSGEVLKGTCFEGTEVSLKFDPKVKYRIDIEDSRVDLFYAAVSYEQTTSLGVGNGIGVGNDLASDIRLFDASFPTEVPGLFAKVAFWLTAGINGEMKVTLTQNIERGIIFQSGGISPIANHSPIDSAAEFSCTASVDVDCTVSLDILAKPMADASLGAGAKVTGTTTIRASGLHCFDIEGSPFASVAVGKHDSLLHDLGLKYEWILTNFGFKPRHFEDGVERECTWDGILKGTCGNCTWTIDSNGLLTIAPINGTDGYLENWTGLPPWNDSSYPVSSAVIKRGVRAKTCNGFFFMMREMKAVDLSGLDTSGVTDMSQMFFGCFALESVDVSHLDTSNVNTMNMMFNCCDNLKTADLSRIDTTKVDNIWHMFGGCSSLVTIYTSSDFAPNIDRTNEPVSVFGSCEQLVGGNGTTYSENHIYSDYARVDAPGSPGYLTLKS